MLLPPGPQARPLRNPAQNQAVGLREREQADPTQSDPYK